MPLNGSLQSHKAKPEKPSAFVLIKSVSEPRREKLSAHDDGISMPDPNLPFSVFSGVDQRVCSERNLLQNYRSESSNQVTQEGLLRQSNEMMMHPLSKVKVQAGANPCTTCTRCQCAAMQQAWLKNQDELKKQDAAQCEEVAEERHRQSGIKLDDE